MLFPQPGIELVPPAVEAQSLKHWTAREAPGATQALWEPVPESSLVCDVGLAFLLLFSIREN